MVTQKPTAAGSGTPARGQRPQARNDPAGR